MKAEIKAKIEAARFRSDHPEAKPLLDEQKKLLSEKKKFETRQKNYEIKRQEREASLKKRMAELADKVKTTLGVEYIERDALPPTFKKTLVKRAPRFDRRFLHS